MKGKAAAPTALLLVSGLAACSFDSSGLKTPAVPRADTTAISFQIDLGTDGPPAPAVDGGPVLPATKRCAEMDVCWAACTSGACRDACAKQGTPDEKTKLQALETCWTQAAATCKTSCPDERIAVCSSCKYRACTAQVAACYTPPAAGTRTCAEILDCYEECPTDACFFSCYFDGSLDAQTTMTAVERCWIEAETGVCQSSCWSDSLLDCWVCEDLLCATVIGVCRAR